MVGKITSTLIGVIIMAAVVAGPVLAGEPIIIKFSHVTAEDAPKGRMANRFQELISERFAGRVAVKVYPDAELYDDDMVMEAMLLGDVQMAAPSLSKLARYNDKFQVFDLPFLFEDRAAVDRFQKSPIGRQLLSSLQIKGFLGLGYLQDGFKVFSSYKRLKVPGDAAGLRFRIQTSEVLAAQFRALDAVSLKRPFSQVLTLLQDHSIDGQENTWSNIYSKRFFQEQPYITASNHGFVSSLVIVSGDFWQTLDKDIQVGLQKALDEAIMYGNKVAEEYERNACQNIVDSRRSEIITLSDTEKSQWINALQPVWKEFADKIGQDLIDAAIASNSAQSHSGTLP